MTNIAQQVLSGTDVKVWLDGEEIGTWTNIDATVTINHQNVQIGYDVDRRAVSWQGDGKISMQATNSIGVKLFNKLKSNRNLRFVIECEITQPATGEVQFTTLNNVTFDTLPIAAWAKGELFEPSMNFRFTPSDTIISQYID